MKFSYGIRSHKRGLAIVIGVYFIVTAITSTQLLSQAKPQYKRPVKGFRTPVTLPLTPFYDVPHPLTAGKPGELIRFESTNDYSLPYELSATRILYHSRTAKGEDVAVSGVILIPDGRAPKGGWPVIAWAHDFTGLARQCAPSLMKNLGSGPLLAMYANLGYAVVVSDYVGLGADGGRAVVDMQSNALDVMYSVAAARAAYPHIGTKWVSVGTLQGGLAAAALAENNTDDPNYLGSVAISGLADAEPAYRRYTQKSSNRLLLAMASSVKALSPEFQVNDILNDKALPDYTRMSQSCGEPQLTAEILKQGWENNAQVKRFFERNTLGTKPAHAPILVISGDVDPVIPADMTQTTVARMCKQGDRLLYLKYPGLDAAGVMGASVSDHISWIRARFNGDTAPRDCSVK